MEWKCDRCRDVAVTTSSNRPEGWAITEVDGEEVIRIVHLCSPCVNSFDLFLEGVDRDEISDAYLTGEGVPVGRPLWRIVNPQGTSILVGFAEPGADEGETQRPSEETERARQETVVERHP
jgi:hypothetical protein